ncbi:MAG TPA: XkdF-like putative serine protease domain-containing protein, partial [Stellaceae bacterium]|nr:XkdF-like putative serine protease domain-containing protein [Stellaceae bacterium]
MRFYAPIAKVDAEERMVWGYASTDAEDDQGETITRDALAAALAGYLKFANIREMHQMSAVGIAEEAAIDDKGLYVAARIVDPRAWDKVRAGVYKGFSVGGRVQARDPADRTIITALTLTEISLVDRPANPEAVFDCWKAEAGGGMVDLADDDGTALDHIHDCLKALTGGDCCKAARTMGR